MEIYHPGDSSWTLLTNMNVARVLPGICMIRDKLIVFGGDRAEDNCLYETLNTSTEHYFL